MKAFRFVIVAMIGAGCASRQPAMDIELLGFPDCPNTPVMRENLRDALRSVGGGLTFRDVNQESLPESDIRRGWPSPTVLVDGVDLFDMAPPATPAMGCRVYPGGVPDAESMAARLRAKQRLAAELPRD